MTHEPSPEGNYPGAEPREILAAWPTDKPLAWEPVEGTTEEAVLFLRMFGSGPELEPILRQHPDFEDNDVPVALTSIRYNNVRGTAEEARVSQRRVRFVSIKAAELLSDYFIEHPTEIPNPKTQELALDRQGERLEAALLRASLDLAGKGETVRVWAVMRELRNTLEALDVETVVPSLLKLEEKGSIKLMQKDQLDESRWVVAPHPDL